MRQGFKIFVIDKNFEQSVEEFCEKHYMKRWELLNQNPLGERLVLVEYRDKFVVEDESND